MSTPPLRMESRRSILSLVMKQGTGAVLAGTGVGVVAALALTRLMSSSLFGVQPTDALTFLSVIALLLLVALRHE
jgi:putative ABC transport system permease protein